MKIPLVVLLIGFCMQGLVKFVVGFAVPYHRRIARIASYYRRNGRIISIYDRPRPTRIDRGDDPESDITHRGTASPVTVERS